MSTQKLLYLHNRAQQQDITQFDSGMRLFERQWVEQTMTKDSESCASVASSAELLALIDRRVRWEAAHESEEARYVREDMSRCEFRVLVQEFALDGLTEAQSFYYVMPRLPLSARLPMLRILIDEFGSANPQRMHSALYIRLLQELNLPLTLGPYLDLIGDASLAFVNQFYWMAVRADDPSCFAGAITYLESAIPHFFSCYLGACQRLGIQAHHYYTEHCHIDRFHALQGRRLLIAMEREGVLDASKAWRGVCLISTITRQAFVEAVHGGCNAWVATCLQEEGDASSAA